LDTVTVRVTVKDVNTGAVIPSARVYVVADAGGDLTAGDEILTGVTDAGGILQTTTFEFTNDQPITGRVRKSTSGDLYKTSPLAGTITETGLDSIVFLIPDA
jgi:hypothetical protein